MKFEQEIKQALKKAGLAEELASKITVESVDDIEAAVTKLATDTKKTADLTGDDFTAALKEAGLDKAFEKALQSETDRRVTAAVKTNTEKLAAEAKKVDEDAEAEREAKEKGETLSEDQKKISSLESTVGELKEMLTGLSTTLSAGDLVTKVKAELKEQGLSEDFASSITETNPEQIASAVTDFKATVDKQTQSSIDVKLEAGELSPVKTGAAGQTMAENMVKDYAANLTGTGAPKNAPFEGIISSETAAKE